MTALVLVGLGGRAPLEAAWRNVLSAAQETREGRARVALAAALAQLPHWGLDVSASGPPGPRDVPAVQLGLYRELDYLAAGGHGRCCATPSSRSPATRRGIPESITSGSSRAPRKPRAVPSRPSTPGRP